jgi:hypothetical protein
MKISPVVVDLFRAVRQTDMKLITFTRNMNGIRTHYRRARGRNTVRTSCVINQLHRFRYK